jgi:hypothetical protein
MPFIFKRPMPERWLNEGALSAKVPELLAIVWRGCCAYLSILPYLYYSRCLYCSRHFCAISPDQGAGYGGAPPGMNMKERQFIVLIADDAPDSGVALLDALSRDPAASHAVIEAEGGGRALEMRRARKPDCLILKGGLPDLRVIGRQAPHS